MRVNGKPAETIPQLVAQRAATEKAPPGSGAKVNHPKGGAAATFGFKEQRLLCPHMDFRQRLERCRQVRQRSRG
jgi:hypothetical protein